MAGCVRDETDRHTFRGFISPSYSLTELLVRGSMVAVVRLEVGFLFSQWHSSPFSSSSVRPSWIFWQSRARMLLWHEEHACVKP